jgi:TolB-like protein
VPADRYTTAAQFAQALAAAPLGSTPAEPGPGPRPDARRTVPWARALVLTLLFIGTTATFVWLRRHSDADARAGPRHLAVLPFENLGNPEDEYFADGMSDAVRGKLTSLPGVQVTARSSSILYKRSGKTPQRIGQELGVKYLLTGTVRWERGSGGPSRVQVSPELIQASTASATWQQPFDAVLDNVFQVQTDIASRVAQALGLAIGAGERKTLAEPPTTNLAAYRAYLKGEEVSNAMAASDPVTVRRAITHYEQAVALDSTFVPAWARLSQAHSLIYYIIAGTPEEREAARSAAERALALAPERPEGRLALGEYHYRVSGDYAQALEQYELGKRVTPRSAELF